MADKKMPDHGCETFGMGCDMVLKKRWDYHDSIGNLRRETTIAADNTVNPGADLLRKFERPD
jgi:hypothetical protein